MAEIKNRIVGSGIVPLDQILFNPRNWRVHPLNQQNALKGVLEEVGWVQDVIINQRTGHLVDGHLRCQLAAREGAKEIPVKYVDLSEEEEALVLATIDPIGAMAVTDKQKLDELFAGIESENENVNKALDDIAEKERLEYGKQTLDAKPQIDRAAELNEKWKVNYGDLWQIGEHRLYCGDSTKREDVERVMGGKKARLVWTDPPYGVNYGDKLESTNPMGYRVRTIENDDLSPDNLEEFLRTALTNVASVCLPGTAIYVACPAGTLLPALIAAFTGSGFTFHWGLVWLKDQIVLSRADYHFKHENILFGWKHENILYGWKHDGAHYFIDDRSQASVFEYPRPKTSEEHPTMKPIELIQHMVRNSSERGDIVVDVFGGSGSTMLACENEKRICRMIELAPKYCAVILERMTTAFPELEIKRIE